VRCVLVALYAGANLRKAGASATKTGLLSRFFSPKQSSINGHVPDPPAAPLPSNRVSEAPQQTPQAPKPAPQRLQPSALRVDLPLHDNNSRPVLPAEEPLGSSQRASAAATTALQSSHWALSLMSTLVSLPIVIELALAARYLIKLMHLHKFRCSATDAGNALPLKMLPGYTQHSSHELTPVLCTLALVSHRGSIWT
jgi:hypothetical protein